MGYSPIHAAQKATTMPDHIYRAEIITQYPHRFETLPVRIYDESGFVIGDITHMELGGIL